MAKEKKSHFSSREQNPPAHSLKSCGAVRARRKKPPGTKEGDEREPGKAERREGGREGRKGRKKEGMKGGRKGTNLYLVRNSICQFHIDHNSKRPN